MPQSKFCPSCGAEIVGEGSSCARCGASLVAQSAQQRNQQSQQGYQQQGYQQQGYQQQPYNQQQAPTSAIDAIKQKPLPFICAAVGVIAMFLPFLSAGGESTSLWEIVTKATPILLLLSMLGIIAVVVFFFVNVPFIAKIVSAAVAFLPTLYYGVLDHAAFVKDVGKAMGINMSGVSVAEIRKYMDAGSFQFDIGLGCLLILAAMAVYAVLTYMENKKNS